MIMKAPSLLYICSNILLLKRLGIPLGMLPELFIIKTIEDLTHTANLIKKLDEILRSQKLIEFQLIPPTCRCNNYINTMNVLPRSLFLLIKRYPPAYPLDFDLFRYDVEFWYSKLQRTLGDELKLLFIYDPIYIPNILIQYIPLLVIGLGGERIPDPSSINIPTYIINDIKFGHAIRFEDQGFIVLGILYTEEYFKRVLKTTHLSINKVETICNPFIYVDPFNSSICNSQHSTIDSFNAGLGNRQRSDADRLIIEFFTSYGATKKSLLSRSEYLWVPIPSSKLLQYIDLYVSSREFKNVLVISPMNNFAEEGSLNPDRIWLSVLKYITKAKRLKSVIATS